MNTLIHVQAKELKKNLPKMRKKLLGAIKKESNGSEYQKNLLIIETLEDTFLFEGYERYFENLIPKSKYSSLDLQNYALAKDTSNPFPTVLCHNDIH